MSSGLWVRRRCRCCSNATGLRAVFICLHFLCSLSDGCDHPDGCREFPLTESTAGSDRARSHVLVVDGLQEITADVCPCSAGGSRHRSSLNSQAKVVIHRDCDLLLRAEVAFCRLDRRMAKQKLKLLRATLPPFETDLNGLPSNSSAECSQATIACLTHRGTTTVRIRLPCRRGPQSPTAPHVLKCPRPQARKLAAQSTSHQ